MRVLVVAIALCLGSWASAEGNPDDEIWLARGRSLALVNQSWSDPNRKARVLSGPLGTFGAENKSVLVIDGATPLLDEGRRTHRSALQNCRRWEPMVATEGEKPNSYACRDSGMRLSTGSESSKLLAQLLEDAEVVAALEATYGVDSKGCWLGRDQGGGIGVVVQNHSMSPDSFHADQVCEHPPHPNRRGLTLLMYPHDVWDLSWRSHLEISGRRADVVARLAPLPSRSIFIDACIEHRATNPTEASAPLNKDLLPSPSLQQVLGSAEAGTTSFPSWRFAVVMQLKCPLIGKEEQVETSGECDASGFSGGGNCKRGEMLFEGGLRPTALPPDTAAFGSDRCTLSRVNAKNLRPEPLGNVPRIIHGVPEHLHWKTNKWTLENWASRAEYENTTLSAWNDKDEPFLFELLERVNRSAALVWESVVGPKGRNSERLKAREWVALYRTLASSEGFRVPEDSKSIGIIDGKALDFNPKLHKEYKPFDAHFGKNLLRLVWKLVEQPAPEAMLPLEGETASSLKRFWSQMRWRYVIIGMAGAGGSMHVDPHHEGFWNVILSGRKRWVLLSPEALGQLLQKDPGIRQRWNKDAHGWYVHEYSRLVKTGIRFEECLIKPGEMIYGPPGWYHIVLGLEDSVSVSEQLVTRRNLDAYARSVIDMVQKEGFDMNSAKRLFCWPWRALAKIEAQSKRPPPVGQELDKLVGC